MTEAPNDFTHCMNSLYYKVGVHGLVFRWCDGAWLRSTRKREDLLNGHTSPNRRKDFDHDSRL